MLALASSRRLLLAGPAVNDRLAQQIEATVVAGAPITAAAALEDLAHARTGGHDAVLVAGCSRGHESQSDAGEATPLVFATCGA
jgi:hypothetical protein